MPFTLDGPEIDVVLEYETTRNALLRRENSYDQGVLSNFAYSVNSIGQRAGLTTTGNAFSTGLNWGWAYNAQGELVQADDQSAAGNDRAYAYDGIGNRQKTVDGLLGDLPASDNWAANSLNQYATIAGYTPTPVHDDDGNLTSGPLPVAPASTATLVWDGENRLISATVGTTTISYTYDHLSRLTSATTSGGTVRYLYDGWNRIAEYNGTAQLAAYLWGLDLSNSAQGAGGVGGLLAISSFAGGSVSDIFYPAYDGNGNVSEYVNAAGAEVAHFEYDPFGNLTVDDQGNAATFSYRFSTKPQDQVTGLYYYGYRFYDPVTGRWPSHDPIGEDGGVNLYGFVANSPNSHIDELGMAKLYSSGFRYRVSIAALDEHQDGTPYAESAESRRNMLNAQQNAATFGLQFSAFESSGPVSKSNVPGTYALGAIPVEVGANTLVKDTFLFFADFLVCLDPDEDADKFTVRINEFGIDVNIIPEKPELSVGQDPRNFPPVRKPVTRRARMGIILSDRSDMGGGRFVSIIVADSPTKLSVLKPWAQSAFRQMGRLDIKQTISLEYDKQTIGTLEHNFEVGRNENGNRVIRP